MKCSELLRNKLEDAFEIYLPAPIQRIWGTCGSWKWHVIDANGVEYGCYYSMKRCVEAKQLVKLESPSNNSVVIDILEL